MASSYEYETFIVTFPAEYVAHVEINRPEKLNSFKESYVLASFPSRSRILIICTVCGLISKRYSIDYPKTQT